METAYNVDEEHAYERLRRRTSGGLPVPGTVVTNPFAFIDRITYIRFGIGLGEISPMAAFPERYTLLKSLVTITVTRYGLTIRQVAEWNTGYSATADFIVTKQFRDVTVAGAWQFQPPADPHNHGVPSGYERPEDHYKEVMQYYWDNDMPIARMLAPRNSDAVRPRDFIAVCEALEGYLPTH